MERDHSRGPKPQQKPAWTPGHNFSLAGCFPWPPLSQRSSPPSLSSYTCGYCRREFRSAQALGGHMNVHRRDRARLRQCCPGYDAPNPNLTAAHRNAAAASPLIPNLNFLPPHHCGTATTAEPVVYSFLWTTTQVAAAATKATVVEVNMDMGTGGVRGRSGATEDDGGLDLELRLG